MHRGDIKIQGMSKVARHKCELLEQLFLQLSIRRVMGLMRKRISTRVKRPIFKEMCNTIPYGRPTGKLLS